VVMQVITATKSEQVIWWNNHWTNYDQFVKELLGENGEEKPSPLNLSKNYNIYST